jgi:hypothetical protein
VLVLLVPAAGAAVSGSGVLAGIGATVKGVLVGSKVKIGLALASTAAVGAVGVAAGPVLFGSTPVQDVGLTGGAPELVVVPPSETHHQPPPQPQQDPRIGIGVLNGRGTGITVPGRSRGSGHQLGANEVPGLPGGDVPGGGTGGDTGDGTGGLGPRDDEPPSTFSTPDHSSTSPRLDTETSSPDLTTTESSDTDSPESADAPELSSTDRPTGSPTATTKPDPSGDDSASTEPSTTVTPTSGKPCPSSTSEVTGSGESPDSTSTTPLGF